jgi:hypothetical protein
MATWLASSRRFAAFVTTFRTKIRKKIRTTPDEESLLDLRLELETAYLLLQEKRLSLEYEPLQAGNMRSPDFAVTFTTSLTFMVEVTRLRPEQKSTAASTPNPLVTTPLIDERLADTVCTKLGQLLPQRSNILLVGVDALRLTADDLRATMLHIQQRAEQNDTAFWQVRGGNGLLGGPQRLTRRQRRRGTRHEQEHRRSREWNPVPHVDISWVVDRRL